MRAGGLLCDTKVASLPSSGTAIGVSTIKERRRTTPLASHPGLRVGDCVPFYFCPRSVMLYVIHMANLTELTYRDGQEPIVHLEADLHQAVTWAGNLDRRWAFTLSNAGSRYFTDHCDLSQLAEVDWVAVHARQWRHHKEGKQAEFLVEGSFPWTLVRRIGVFSTAVEEQVRRSIQSSSHSPKLEVRREWYY